MVLSNVTSDRGIAAMASRFAVVSVRICCVVCWISVGVKSHTIGGRVGSVAALRARDFSTLL